MQSNLIQFYSFMQTLLGGIAIGFFYDMSVRGIFSSVKKRSLVDIIFLICAFAVTLAILISAADLAIRLYFAVGLGAGLLLYFYLFSPFVLKIIAAIRNIFLKTGYAVYKPVKAAGVRFKVKNKEKIAKINSALKKTASIPNYLKMSYNKYAKYFFKGRKSGSKQNETE